MIRNDLSNSEYHAGEGLSKSDLDALHKSPAHYKARFVMTSPALEFGTALHMAVLEPELFNKTYSILPADFNGRTKEGKALLSDLTEQGLTALKAEDAGAILHMRGNILAHPIASVLLKDAQCELSGFAEVDGVLCKCRPDIWNAKRGIIADLKTTRDASQRGFGKSAASFRYHVQAAFYTDVWGKAAETPVNVFVFIAVEKEPPYAVALYTLSQDFITLGRADYRDDLQTYRECEASGKWPGYPQTISELEPPAWL